MNKLAKFIYAMVFQVIIIFVIIIFKVSVLTGGTEIFLKILPIDPTNPLRGDYITFQYDISNLDQYLFNNLQARNGDTVYVVLNQNRFWTVENVSFNKPLDRNKVFIKGKVLGTGTEIRPGVFSNPQHNNFRINVVYGIEEYFIPEGKGRNFNFSNKEAVAGVMVDDEGNAVLKQIYIDGKPWP